MEHSRHLPIKNGMRLCTWFSLNINTLVIQFHVAQPLYGILSVTAENLLQERESEKVKLEEQEKEKRTLVTNLQKKQKGLQNEINKKRREANLLNARIDKLIAEEIERARKRAQGEARRGDGFVRSDPGNILVPRCRRRGSYGGDHPTQLYADQGGRLADHKTGTQTHRRRPCAAASVGEKIGGLIYLYFSTS